MQLSKDEINSLLQGVVDNSALKQLSTQEAEAVANRVVQTRAATTEDEKSFPPAFFKQKYVRIEDLKKTGLPVDEVTYLALGGGLGSFTWVDHLRGYGVKAESIAAIGFEAKPYARYRRLCINSQIPDHERLRSDSGSTPDNLWGWPGYALREIWWDINRGRLGHAIHVLWQLF